MQEIAYIIVYFIEKLYPKRMNHRHWLEKIAGKIVKDENNEENSEKKSTQTRLFTS